MAITPGPFEMLILFLLGGGFLTPFGFPPTKEDPLMAKTAPAECLVYASWAGTGEPDPQSSNHTEQLLAEPEIQQFLTQSSSTIFKLFRSQGPMAQDPQTQQNLVDLQKLITLLHGKSGSVFLSEIRFNGNGPPAIKGGALLHVDDDADELKTLLEKLQSRIPDGTISKVQIAHRSFWNVQFDEDAPSIHWGIDGQYLVVGLGDGSAEKLIQRRSGQAPAWLNRVRKRLSVPRPASLVYVNVNAIVQLGLEQGNSAEAVQAISALGIDAIQSLATVTGMDEEGCVSRSLLTVDRPSQGFLSCMIDAPPLTEDDLKIINRDAPAAVVFKFDPARVFDAWFKFLRVVNPRDAQQMTEELAQFERQVGIRVREDVLGSFGDTWRIFAQPGPAGLITGWSIAIEVRDRARLEKVQDTLLALARRTLDEAGPGAPELQSSTVNGHAVHMLRFGQLGVPVAPSWCLTDHELFITLMPPAMPPLLSGNDEQASVVQQPEMKAMFAGDSRNLALVYLDTRQIVEIVLPFAKTALQASGLQQNLPFLDTSHLPAADVFLSHLQPTVAALRRTEDGVESVFHQTMPAGNLGAAAPVLAAMLFPAVGQARVAAQQSASKNNLKQIALAMHNFHDTHRAFPAGYSADADGKPLLSWRVHVLPFLDEADLYNQFHLDEPWDSPHNKKLIKKIPNVLRSPRSKAKPGWTNYLGVGGADGVFVRPQPGNRLGTPIRQILDGTSNTIMIVEANDDSAVIWTKPGDFAPDKKNPMLGLVGLYSEGFVAALTDGSVRFIGASIDAKILRALFTKSGGEVVRLP